MSPCTKRLKVSPPPMRVWSWLRPQTTRATRTRFLPGIDRMEDRTLLSTWMVTNTNDSGTGSLRYEVGQASSGDAVDFASNLSGQTITLASGPITLGVNVTIEGLGANNPTVSGGGKQQVFVVSSGVTATIESLTIADGLAAQGGGIDNFGDLTVTGCTISGNLAVGGAGDSTTPEAANGGGIANEVATA